MFMPQLRVSTTTASLNSGRAVVIGGGLSGTTSALELKRAGWGDVILVEKAHPGYGSSSRSAAGIRQQFTTKNTVQAMRFARSYLQDLARELRAPHLLRQNGYLFLKDNAKAMQRAREAVAMQQAAGLREVRVLNDSDLRARFPFLNPDAGLIGATFCPTDGFFAPEVVYNGAIILAQGLGVQVRQKTEVIGANLKGDRIASLKTKHTHTGATDTIKVDVVVDTTNIWTNKLAPILGGAVLDVNAFKRVLWYADRAGADMSRETLAGMPLIIGPTGLYWKPESGEQLVFSHTQDVEPEPNFDDADQDEVPGFLSKADGYDGLAYASLFELIRLLPAVVDFKYFTAETGGYYGSTPDHNPFLGFDPYLRNLIRAVGFSGHGAMFCPFTAHAVAALAAAGADIDRVVLQLLDPRSAPDDSSLAKLFADDGPIEVGMGAFRIGRSYEAHEANVI